MWLIVAFSETRLNTWKAIVHWNLVYEPGRIGDEVVTTNINPG